MKYIVKGPEPEKFTDWKNQANDDWTPTYDKLRGEEKKLILMALTEEQGFICCYCERRLEINNCHIEHLRPQAFYIDLQLNYSNLLCSCQLDLERRAPRHCGNSKGNWFDKDLMITPIMSDCEMKFKYTHDGYIMPSDETDIATNNTIDKLQLKIDKLNALRRMAIEPFLDEILSDEDIETFTTGYLVERNNNGGMFNEFYTTIKYLFQNN